VRRRGEGARRETGINIGWLKRPALVDADGLVKLSRNADEPKAGDLHPDPVCPRTLRP
jgi:hypothetical protein